MEKRVVVISFVLLFVLTAGMKLSAQEGAEWQDISGGNSKCKYILIETGNPATIYMACVTGIFKTNDSGLDWRNVFSARGENRKVNFLAFDSTDNKFIYAATGNGLFVSGNEAKSWKRIFHGKNFLENNCTSVAVKSDLLVVGTKGGLFISKDRGRSWLRQAGKLASSSIRTVALQSTGENEIYVACSDGIFLTSDAGSHWDRIFVLSPAEQTDNDDEIPENLEEEIKTSSIDYLCLDPTKGYIYAAVSGKVYESKDKGKSWNLFSMFGLLDKDIRYLGIYEDSQLYAVTKAGIFIYKDERWHEFSQGIASCDFNCLSMDKAGVLYAAGEGGLFKSDSAFKKKVHTQKVLAPYYENEPNITQVQAAAIKYAEVEPEKIINWRRKAAKKAFFPKVSVGLDRDASDLWHWETGSSTKLGDDYLMRGKEVLGWDVTFTWDLGEVIWNSEQASIDVRSRLMVQLREDILDEVNKIYFERLRVKMELDNLSIEDKKRYYEKELKLQELSASLDALTGGFFTSAINSKPGS